MTSRRDIGVSRYEAELAVYVVSEWLLFHATSAFLTYTAISWREQANFQSDDDEVRSILDQHAWLDFYCANSLKQQSAGRDVAPFWYIILIPSQPVFALSP